MQWLALWKSYTHYRNDATVWSNNFKDFIVADHPSLSYNSEQHMHLGRTPVSPNESGDSHWLRLAPQYGTVLHYQFAAYNNFQLKQAFGLDVLNLFKHQEQNQQLIQSIQLLFSILMLV